MRKLILPLLVCWVLAPVPSSRLAAQERSVLRLLPTDGRLLEREGEVQGALSASDFLSPDDVYLEAWSINGVPGTSVTIDLISDDFDPVLFVAGPGLTQTLQDDDGGGGCNARITVRFLEEGAFHVVATATPVNTTGTFSIRTSERAPPPLPYGCGEMDPAVLTGLPTDGRVLNVGESHTGRIDRNSPNVFNDQPVVAWSLAADAGEAVTITMTSSDLDSYLFAYGPGMERVEMDDDGAGELNARLTLEFDVSGSYTVGASALSSGSGGSYALTVERARGIADLPVAGALTIPGSAAGILSDDDPLIEGRPSQTWTFEGTAGQTVTIELSSADFDSYLTVLGPGITVPMEDDDSAGDLDSRVVLTVRETGTFRIIAAALGAGGGTYTLTVR